jgi:tRNA(His) 5'-end guanylyltransferase
MPDALGDRMKTYEGMETKRRLMPRLPVYARIDGKTFSKFTSDLMRPYDERLTQCMVETTKYLVDQTDALIGYTQSDEISLGWYADDPQTQMLFGGKVQKLTSVLAAMATAKFNQSVATHLPHKVDQLPVFDARVFSVPNQDELANAFLWREMDATKNAISMAARSMFSHRALEGKNGKEMQEMMWQEFAVNFNDYPAFFKRGTWVRKVTEERVLTDAELARIPEAHQPKGPVLRSRVRELEVPNFRKVTNRVGFIFDGEDPQTEDV